MFADQEQLAFDLGHRMAGAGFSIQDNPFARLHPRFARQWARGFDGRNALARLASATTRAGRPGGAQQTD